MGKKAQKIPWSRPNLIETNREPLKTRFRTVFTHKK